MTRQSDPFVVAEDWMRPIPAVVISLDSRRAQGWRAEARAAEPEPVGRWVGYCTAFVIAATIALALI